MLYLKRLCGVTSTTSHAVILAELNMHSLKHFWWQQTIAVWNALASAPASCLHRLVLFDNLQDGSLHSVHNFSWSVSHCLCNVGYHLPTQVQSIPVIYINTVIAGLNKPLFHGTICHPTHAQRPPGMPNCVHGIIGFALSTYPTDIFFYLFLASA